MEKTGIELIAIEREEQINKHGFDLSKDEFYKNGEIGDVVLCLVLDKYDLYPESWGKWFIDKIESKRKRMSKKDFDIERLKIAGALIAAEIDRLQHNNNEN